MKLLKLSLLVILFAKFVSSNNANNNTLHQFVVDYFDDKNVTVRLIVCWKSDEIKALTYKFFKGNYPRQTYIHTNFSNVDFLSTMHFNIYNVVDISCDNVEYILQKVSCFTAYGVTQGLVKSKIIQQANDLDMYRAPQKWLLIQSQTEAITDTSLYFDTYKSLLNPYDIQIDSEVACAENNENETMVWYYYKVNENTTIIRELYGTWNNTYGFHSNISQNVTSFRRKNLHLSNIRIVSIMNDNDTMIHLDDYKYPMVDTVTKTQYFILMSLMDYMNTTPVIIWADQWGVIEDYATESWGGMTGFIQRKEGDISGTAMFFFKARLKIGKFLKLTHPSTVQFIFRKPPLSIEQNIYALPFSWSVWLSSLLLIVVVSSFFVLFSHFENPRNQEIEKVGYGNILLLMAAAVCQQGCDIVPTGVPGRILTLLVFTAFMFLYVSYSANIVALLQSSSDSIKDMEDLLNSRNMKVGCHNISYNFQYFQNATERVRKAIYKEKIGPHGYYELEDGIEKIRQGLFAFHVEEGSAYYYILRTFEEHEKCDTTTMPGVFDAQFGWMLARSNSPHVELFKIGLYKLGEYGIETRFYKRFYRKSQCYFSAASFTSVGMIDFYPAIIVFLYGLLIAIAIFALEHVHNKYSQKQNIRKIGVVFKK